MFIDALPDRMRGSAVALWRATGLTRPWNDPDADLDRALRSPASTVLAAIDDGDGGLVGTAMVGHDGHRGWIYYLAVHPRRQGRGVGRRLVEACELWLDGRVPKVHLMVRSGNGAARGFYEHLGYELSDVVVLGRRLP